MRAELRLVCGACERGIEVCAVCDSQECSEPVCYRCLTIDLGERVPHPHGHGD